MTQSKPRRLTPKQFATRNNPKAASQPAGGAAGHGVASAAPGTASKTPRRREAGQLGKDSFWLYGWHAVNAALRNPARQKLRFLASEGNIKALPGQHLPDIPQPEVADADRLSNILPAGAVHQGLALLVRDLPEPSLEQICSKTADGGPAMVVVLDQVTDPQNAGAILRSCAAFGASALIMTGHHAPPATGVLAKAASGALELTPILRASNLARILEQLAARGFWRIGLDSEAQQPISEIDMSGNIALVLGAEGSGLRQLTARKCDFMARLPTKSKLASLNVSNAAAIILYEAARRRGGA